MRKRICLALLCLIGLVILKPFSVKAADTLTIKVGANPSLYCGSYYDNGYDKQWISSNSSIVAVTGYRGANCNIVAKSIGQCEVTFFCKYNKFQVVDYKNGKPVFGYLPHSYSYTFHIQVTTNGEAPVGSISLNPKVENIVPGQSRLLNYEIQDINKKVISNYNKLSWFSSNPKVATVNKIGMVTAWSTGKAVITAKSPNGKIGTCTITVGVPKNYITIASANDLHKIRTNLTGNYILTKDIIFKDSDFAKKGSFYNSGAGFTPINRFKGILEGNGHKIVNLRSKATDAGLFTNLTGTIRNLEIKNSIFTGTNRAGAFAAYADYEKVGEYQSVINCTSANNTISAPIAGGLVGACNARAEYIQCSNSSTVKGSKAAGGVMGTDGGYSIILMCSNKGTITSNASTSGNIGGIAGTGGLISHYQYCSNTGNIEGHGNVGGLIGCSGIYSEIDECYNTGKIKGNSAATYAGGIAGRAGKTYVTNCYNHGALELVYSDTGKGLLGGIVAINLVDGFSVSDDPLLLNNCVNTGSLKITGPGALKAGSILATIAGAGNLGQQVAVNNCYYLDSTCARAIHTLFVGTADNVTSLTAAQMKSSGNFMGLDFGRVWEMKKGASYPTLRWQSERSKVGTVSAPSTFKATVKSYSSVLLSWSAVKYASGYEIYRSTSASKNYKRIAYTTGTKNTNTKLNTGTTYYYKVRAYRMLGTKKVYSGYTSIRSGKTKLSTPQKCKTYKAGSTSIKLKWSKVSGASGYEITYSKSKKGKYTKLKTTTSVQYTNKKLKKGKTYYYKIRAYRKVGKKKVYSSWSAIVHRKL